MSEILIMYGVKLSQQPTIPRQQAAITHLFFRNDLNFMTSLFDAFLCTRDGDEIIVLFGTRDGDLGGSGQLQVLQFLAALT